MSMSEHTGAIQHVGDYHYRISKEYTTVVWYLTERCNFRCDYCVGWHHGGKDCLTDLFSVEEIVEAFHRMQKNSKRKLYIWLTGGEPSIVTNFNQLALQLTQDMHIELQTNLCTKHIVQFAKEVDPQKVGDVMATYHSSILDKNKALKSLYFKNFQLLSEQGFNVIIS